MPLIDIKDRILWKIVLIHVKITGLLFKISIFRPNTCAVCYLALPIVIKLRSYNGCLNVFFLDNAKFFVKEIRSDFLIASETELTTELFAAPIKNIAAALIS